MPGISTSSSATSGWCSSAAGTTASPVPTSATTCEVRLEVQQRGERAAHERLVVGQQQRDRHRTLTGAIVRLSTGTLTESSKPRGWRVRVTSTAPAAAARSRSPSSPWPCGLLTLRPGAVVA